MARYETPGQVLALFTAAAAVSCLLILLLTAEARARQHRQDGDTEAGGQEGKGGKTGEDDESGGKEGWGLISLRSLARKLGLAGGRKKRASEGERRQVRHLRARVAMLGRKDPLVSAVLAEFCGNTSSVTFVLCQDSSNNVTQQGEQQDYHQQVSSYVAGMTERLAPGHVGDGTECNSQPAITNLHIVVLTSIANLVMFSLLYCLCCHCRSDNHQGSRKCLVAA